MLSYIHTSHSTISIEIHNSVSGVQAWGSASLDTPDMLGWSREDSALGLASLETVLAAFASFLAVDGASLLPALEHLDPQAVLLLQHARLQCEVDPTILHH